MSRLAGQAIVLSLARFASYGLTIVSPVVLARILPIEALGRYRVFLLGVTVLIPFASFSIYESLLYLMPRHPTQRWRVLRQTALMVAACSCIVIALVVIADLGLHGRLFGAYLLPLAIYTLLHVNFDFWEWYWIADHQLAPVFLYSSGRLMLRMAMVVTLAIVTGDVTTIIWGLIALESIRFLVCAVAWQRMIRRGERAPDRELYVEQWRFVAPMGVALMVSTLSRNVSSFVVLRWLGAVPLALYSYGLCAEPVIVALRNSLSAIVLPEMVRRSSEPAEAAGLWQRATVINSILLLPVAVLTATFGRQLVITVFGPALAGAGPVLQLYALIMVRECFDFSLLMRAANRNTPMVYGTVIALAVTGLLLPLALPVWGVTGAAAAMAAGSAAEACFQLWSICRRTGLRAQAVIPWKRVSKVLTAALLAATVLLLPVWRGLPAAAGIICASAAYGAVYVGALWALRVAEARLIWERLSRRKAAAEGIAS